MDEMQNGEVEVVAEEIEQQQEAEAATEQKSVVEDDVPEEFKGKSSAEIARIALHARREMGRQANELGEVRRLADELIKSQLHKPKEQQESSAEVDVFENPKEAIRREIEANPEFLSMKRNAEQARKESAKQKMFQLHPDAMQITQDENFNSWISKSKIRQKLLNDAHFNFDVDAADELFTTYKALRAVKNTAISDSEKAARKQAVNAAGVDSGGSGEKSKKIYKRDFILNTMAFDKKKWAQIKDDVELAYIEGRVR